MSEMTERERLLRKGLQALRQAEAAILLSRALQKIPNPHTERALSKTRNALKIFQEEVNKTGLDFEDFDRDGDL